MGAQPGGMMPGMMNPAMGGQAAFSPMAQAGYNQDYTGR